MKYLDVLAFFSCLVIIFVALGIHAVDEGCIGMYWRGGALLDGYTEPGYHFKIPFFTTFENVQITLQTDVVRNIPCGTSGGVMVYFGEIEVVNRLQKPFAHETIKQYGPNYDKTWIFDRIHHEINQFCSCHTLQEVYITEFDTLDEALANALQVQCNNWNTGIEIITIRVTKPSIPKEVMANYLRVAEETTSLLVAQQHQLVLQKEIETQRLTALALAQKELEVAKIDSEKQAAIAILAQTREANVTRIRLEKELREKENESKKVVIDSETLAAKEIILANSQAEIGRIQIKSQLELKEAELKMKEFDAKIISMLQKAQSDASAYDIFKKGEANRELLTPEYLQMQLYSSLLNNTKIYFGEDIPKMFMSWNSNPFESAQEKQSSSVLDQIKTNEETEQKRNINRDDKKSNINNHQKKEL